MNLITNQNTSATLPTETLQQEILQVSQLNSMAKNALESTFDTVWVEGEISNLSRPQSGHIYLTLKDNNAQIRAAFFKYAQRGSTLELSNGQLVLIKGKVSLYTNRGDYQLIIEQMDPAGAGKLQQAFEALKNKLAQEGLFSPEYKQTIPPIPRTIGIVTSPTGAALQDMLQILSRRFPWSRIIIYPTAVQGQAAATQISDAIARANQRHEVDVLIVSRGGGSLEDLWPFNEEVVARAIFDSKIPTISAVGHQTDVTISDFVADLRAPTPSAAAERVAPEQQVLLDQFTSTYRLLTQYMQRELKKHQQQLNALARHIREPGSLLMNHMQRVDDLFMRLERALHSMLQQQRLTLHTLTSRLEYLNPHLQIQLRQDKLDNIRARLHRQMRTLLHQHQQQLQFLLERLMGISPRKTLERGYSITRTESGQIISRIKQIKTGQALELCFHDGTAKVQVLD